MVTLRAIASISPLSLPIDSGDTPRNLHGEFDSDNPTTSAAGILHAADVYYCGLAICLGGRAAPDTSNDLIYISFVHFSQFSQATLLHSRSHFFVLFC